MTKRRYFDLLDDMLVPGRWHLGEILLPDGLEPRLSAGIRFDPRADISTSFTGMDSQGHPLLSAEVSRPGRPLDYCITAFNRPIARASLANSIATVAGSDIQCLPVRINKNEDFCVLNAVRVVRCIDENRSEFGKWSEQDQRPDKLGKYKGVTRLRLDPRLIPEDAHFFRLKDWEVALIVSEQVKVAMERAGCLGAKFEEVTGASELS